MEDKLIDWPLYEVSYCAAREIFFLNCLLSFFFNFYICTVRLDTIKVYYSPTNAQVIDLKTILQFTLKLLRHVSVQSHHLRGAHYPCLLKLHFVKIVNYGSSVCVTKSVVMWLHILVVSLLMCVCRTVRE